MTDRELMQQALVALGAMQSYAAAENKGLRICDEAIEALRARLAQPDLITHADVEQLARIEKLVEDVDPYTAPTREWQGLTNEEISAIDWKQNETLHDFARAIEAKLRGKNGV